MNLKKSLRAAVAAVTLAGILLAGDARGSSPPVYTAAALSTYTCTGADRVVSAGDSITAGGIGGVSVPWNQYLQAQINPGFFVSVGASGTTWQWLLDNYTVVTQYNPSLAFLQWGVNDAFTAHGPGPTAATMVAAIRAIWAVKPSCRIVILPILAFGEQWPNLANATDSTMNAYNAAMLDAVNNTLAHEGTITWVDWRAAWFVAEQQANPTNDSAGSYLMISDHLHLNDAGAHYASNYVASRQGP